MSDNRIDMRVWFSKEGPAAYIAHLDTMRTMQRAFARAAIPLWFTEGFNPHAYMTFALPLSLGVWSHCETVDIRLTEPMDPQELCARLSAALPACMKAVHAAPPVHSPNDIAAARYAVRLSDETLSAAEIAAAWETFIAAEQIIVTKKSKKGPQQVDLKPFVTVEEAKAEEEFCLILRLPAGNTHNINPALLLGAFYTALGRQPDYIDIGRLSILDTEGNLFA